MKKHITLFVLFISTIFYAQTTGISYQAVIYNPTPEVLPGYSQANAPLVNKNVCLKFSIIDAASAIEYQETIKTTTDEFGMVNLTIGTGTPIGGYAALFEDIVWDSSTKKLQVELDVNGSCATFLEISHQSFTAVPFAYASKTAENVTGVVAIVNGGTGANTVSGAKINLGLNNVDNTSDLNKPISTATQVALNTKENTANKSGDVNLGSSNTLFPTQNAVKTYVDSKINTGGADLALEVSRATTVENTLTNNLAAEVIRATNAENTLTTNLNAEIARATAAENTKENAVNKSDDVTLGTSAILFPTQNAVKTYVDNQVAEATPDASSSVKGKIKLAGDLTGTAALPLVQNNAITSAKIANATIVNEDIADATITSAKIAGTISVANGGTGANMSNSAGYIKQVTPGANFTTVYPIPATDVFGAVRFVNGSPPNSITGNVAVPFGYVTTGLFSSRPGITTTNNGDIFVTSGETGANASANGRTYISTGASGSWNEVTSNQASTDARYVQLAGSTMQGNLAFPSNTKITIVDVPTSSNDVTNKQYVDSQIASGAPNATTTLIGKVQLAGDLGGSGTTASAPVISNDAIITNKIKDTAVTNAKLATDAVTTDKILDGAIVNDDIANATITTTKISGAISIDNGGTGATSATEALTNLGAEPTINKSIASDLGANTSSNTLFPSQLAVKTYVDGKSATLATDLQTEITNRTTADTAINTTLSSEITRATGAESTLTTNLAAEVTRATAAENIKEDKANKATAVDMGGTNADDVKYPTQLAVKTYVDGKSATLATDLQTEITNRTTADTAINTTLSSEITRATGAESTLTTNLAAEVTRATAAENTKEDKANKATAVDMGGTTADDVKYPTQLAVKTYVDNQVTTATPNASNTVLGKIKLSGDLAGSNDATNPVIANSVITTIKIADLNVTNAKLEANVITTDKIKDGEVQTADIKDANVTTVKIADANVTNAKLADDAVTTAKILDGTIVVTDLANDAVETSKIKNLNVTNAKLEANAITTDKIKDSEVQTADIKDANVTTSKIASGGNNTVLVTDGSGAVAWLDKNSFGAVADLVTIEGSGTTASPFKVKDLGIVTAKLADGAVTNVKVATDAITTDKIKDGEVQTDDIKDANITTVKIADANVTNAKLAANAVTTDKILDGTIVVTDLANDAVETSKIKDSNVTTAKIADANVTTAKMEHGAADQVLKTNTAGNGVEWGKLSAANLVGKNLTAADASITVGNGVGSTLIDANLKVTDLGITTAKLAAAAVTTDKITDANITEAKLAADAVTSAKVLDGTIATADLGNNSVATDKIIDAAVTTTKIANANVTNTKLADDAVSSAKILNGTVVNEDIADATITTAKIAGTIAISQGGTGAATATGALTNLGAEAVANKATAIDMDGANADNVKYPTQLAVKTFVVNSINGVVTTTQTALNLKEDVSNKSTNVALGTSDQLYPSQNAVKSYVDTKLTTTNAISNLTYLPNISNNRILGNTSGATTTPQEIPLTGSGDVVLKTSAEINTPTITSPVLNGTISGSAIVPVKQGGSGADMSTTAGYVKQASTGANFTTVAQIPLNDVAGAIKSVNGVTPDATTGNVSVALGKVTTGSSSTPSVTGTPVNSDIYVIAGQTTTPNDNGRTFIYDGSHWNEVATNISTTDNRYVKLTGSNMSGTLNFPTGTKVTVIDAPSAGTDLTNKTYVDDKIAASTTDALTSATGKIQLAGDLTGTATLPEIAANKVTFSKMQKIDSNTILGRSTSGNGNIESLTTLPVATLPALTGDVTTTAGTAATTITNQAVTLAKMQNLSAQSKLLGTPSTGGLGVAEISLGTGLSMSGGTLSATGGTVTNVTGTTDRITVTNGATTPTVDISTNYVGQSSISTLGTITTGTWNATTIAVPNGGTGATTLTGYVKGAGTTAMTASATIPVEDVTGAQTITNISTDGTFTSSNDTNYPSQLAVKTYVDAKVAAATLDATATATGKIQLAGDLTGTATAPVVGIGKITSDKILDATIATADIAASAVTSSIIADGAIGTADLGTGAVTNAKIGETITVTNGGTGATSLTGYVKGAGTTAMTASATIPVEDVTGAQTVANLSANITTNTGSTTMYPSVAAVETYVSNNATLDATTTSKGKIKLAGDLSGTADAPTVPGLALKAPLASPALTGTPTAPTAVSGTNTTQVATTEFVSTAVAAATIADADATTKGKIQLYGDLGGTAEAPLVVKIQGTAINSTAPITNQLLQFDGTEWKPVSKSAIIKMETEEVTPSNGQSSFTTSNTPIGKLAFYINGVRVPKNAISISGSTISYNPVENGNYVILGTDRISFDYIY